MADSDCSQTPVVLITGASSGIGNTTATLLSKRGYRVFGTSRRPQPNVAFPVLPLEVSSDDAVTACVQTVLAHAGRLDVLVNNVGSGIAGAAEETTLDEAQRLFETNFWGAVRLTNVILPIMRQQHRGRIINLSSVGGLIGIPFRAFYAASKFALEGYSESLRYEVARFGISVSLVEPTGVKTPAGDHVPNAARSIDDYLAARRRLTAAFNRSMQNGMPPRRVAETIQRIIESRSPRLRYTVGPQAAFLTLMRRLMPQTIFESTLRIIFHLNDHSSPE